MAHQQYTGKQLLFRIVAIRLEARLEARLTALTELMQLIVLTGKRSLNSSNVTLHFGFRIITTLKGNKTETALEQLTWLTKTKGILTACVSRWKTGCGPAGRRR